MTLLGMAASQIDRLSVLFAVLAFGAAAVVAMRWWPRLGVIAWFGVIAFVPDWMGVKAGPYFTPATLTALAVLAAMIPLTVPRLGAADALMAAFFAAALLPLSIGGLRVSVLFTLTTIWILAFTLGRIMPMRVDLQWIGAAFAIVMGVVALGAVAEFLLTSNPFVTLTASNNAYFAWSPLQERGGVLRAEGAFGHSIALGASLALAIPFAVGARFRTHWRVLLVLAMVAGIAVTFSRAAMLSGAAALLLSLYGLRTGISPRVKVGVLAGGLVAVAALQPFVATVFTDAGAEAAKSGAYRESLLSLVGGISLLGQSAATRISASGESFHGEFNSVDSAFLLLGLNYGALALALGLVAYVAAGIMVLRRRGGPAVIAVVAQGPALLTVALITQYAALFWFTAGLAVYSLLRAGEGSSVKQPPLEDATDATGSSALATGPARLGLVGSGG